MYAMENFHFNLSFEKTKYMTWVRYLKNKFIWTVKLFIESMYITKKSRAYKISQRYDKADSKSCVTMIHIAGFV